MSGQWWCVHEDGRRHALMPDEDGMVTSCAGDEHCTCGDPLCADEPWADSLDLS